MSTALSINNSLPTIQELYKNTELAINQEAFNHYLNQQPPSAWVKVHPFISGYRYLPIDKVEFLLRKFFKSYKIEVVKTGMLLNSVEVTVRVHYLDPITEQWMYHDGVGAEELQTKKDSGNLQIDMSNINKGAVKMALPIAKTIAIKDACDHFGEIFGSSLNRKDVYAFSVDEKLTDVAKAKEEKRVEKLIEKATTIEEMDQLEQHCLTENTKTLWQAKHLLLEK